MKKIFYAFIFFYSINIFSQEDDRLRFYNLEGVEYKIKENKPITIQYFINNYLPGVKFTKSFSFKSSEEILAIFYHEFTDKPLFVLGGKPTKEQISKELSLFNYQNYLKDWQFDYNLKNYIKSGDLIIDDLYRLFGKPDERVETSNITVFMYKSLKLNFTIKDYKVVDFLHY
jgi:hypothetical protein